MYECSECNVLHRDNVVCCLGKRTIILDTVESAIVNGLLDIISDSGLSINTNVTKRSPDQIEIGVWIPYDVAWSKYGGHINIVGENIHVYITHCIRDICIPLADPQCFQLFRETLSKFFDR